MCLFKIVQNNTDIIALFELKNVSMDKKDRYERMERVG